MSAPQRPDEPAEATPPSRWRRLAPFVAAGAAGLVAAAGVLALTQWVIDRENGVAKPVVATARAQSDPPASPPARKPSSGEECMTSRQYEHLQRLPAYGVVKTNSALAGKLRRDGGP
jgi:hypothetical protein